MGQFTFGIMGAAKIANKFCDAVKQIEGCSVIAVASKSMERAKDFCDKNKIPAAYDSYEQMLEEAKPDAVYIAVTSDAHFELTMLCLSKRVPVLCEKAMFLSSAQAQEAFDLAKREGIFVMEAMWSRFLPAVQKAKQWYAEGRVGKAACVDSAIGFVAEKNNENRYYSKALGGGAAFDLTVYAYEIPVFVIGRPVDHVQAAAVFSESGVDVTDCVIFRMGEVLGTLRTSFAATLDQQMSIYGDMGRIVLPNPHFASEAFCYDKDGNLTEHFKDEETTNGFVYEIKETIRCVQEGKTESEIVPFETTLDCARLFDRIMESGTV